MKKVISLIAISILITSIILFTPVSAQSNPDKFVPNRLLVKFKDDVNASDKIKTVEKLGGKIVDNIPKIDVKIINLPDNAIEKVKIALSNNPLVEYVEYDKLHAPQMIPNDEWYYNQWYLEKINLPAAWDSTTGDPSVIIAILDTGVDNTQPDLKDRVLPVFNAYNQSASSVDTCNHGTRVAGVAAASSNNMIGVAGVAWNVKILPIIVVNENCYGSDSTFSKGLIYSADHGAKVANLSFGPLMDSQTLVDSARYFTDNGGLVVTAAGNTSREEFFENSPYLINVSATEQTDSITTWSSYGPSVDFSAPGEYIRSTKSDGGYAAVSGTSFSAPVVSGIIGLVYSVNPNLTPDQVFEILKKSSNDLGEPGYDTSYGWGRVDAGKAVQFAKNFEMINPPPTLSINNVSLSEGNSGTTGFDFIVTRSSGIGASTIDYTTAPVTAAAGTDYTSTSGTLAFAAGETTKTITVLVNGDTAVETDETFNVNLASCIGCTITTSQGTRTIQNDDAAPAPTVPTAPVLSSTGISSAAIDISWTIANGDSTITGYTYQWSTDNFASIMGSQSVGSGANSATITNLSTSTQYNIRIYATNAIGNSVFSNIISVTTTELSPITPFSISIINPTDNSTIKGKTIVSIESNVPVKRVEVYFDSTLKKVLSGSLNYQFNTRGISSGVHVILVKAFDSLGRTDTDSVSVNIN